MIESATVERRRQYCFRCGQLMFEYYRSPDGHFGVVDALESGQKRAEARSRGFRCRQCGARYRLLDRLGVMGQPVEKI